MSQSPQQLPPSGSPGAVLAVVRKARQAESAAALAVFVGAVEWAAVHEVPAGEGDAFWVYGNEVPLAGDGVPGVGEYAVAEFAAATGMSTDAGRQFIGDALEVAWRLPKLWEQVQAGTVPVWRARMVAHQTRILTREAAGFVDKHVAAVAGKVGPAQLERLILEAKGRYMPLSLEDQSEDYLPDRRHVTIFDDQVSADGTVAMAAVVDYGDALDIETALQETAAQLKLAGSADTLDGRRAAALGEMARNQLALTFEAPDGAGLVEERAQRASRNRRPVTLYVHLSEDALTTTVGKVGRCENARTPITAETIRSWCGNPSVTLTVKPVIDLADHIRVDAYEVPDRLKERVTLRDLGCVFPWCTRPARSCDHDHTIPHDQGGPTCSCNVAPLCRHHHRLKTHTPWRYRLLEPGVYLWTSPHGYVFLRDPSGTTDVTPTGLTPIPGCPDTTADADPPPE